MEHKIETRNFLFLQLMIDGKKSTTAKKDILKTAMASGMYEAAVIMGQLVSKRRQACWMQASGAVAKELFPTLKLDLSYLDLMSSLSECWQDCPSFSEDTAQCVKELTNLRTINKKGADE